MARLTPKPESEKLQDVVSTIEHIESISKAAKLLETIKETQGERKVIRITYDLQIEVPAKLSKQEVIERVKRFIYRNQIEEKRLHPTVKNLLYGKRKRLSTEIKEAV